MEEVHKSAWKIYKSLTDADAKEILFVSFNSRPLSFPLGCANRAQKVAKPIYDFITVHFLGCGGNAASRFFKEMEDGYLVRIQDVKLFGYIYMYVSFRQLSLSISFMRHKGDIIHLSPLPPNGHSLLP
ncbi:hypothetical protein XU18_4966 [Perkinsela sp. CCAP 1560/4]|nr:hypothetical protein XU18_4966 [Perkinsela sp. CCAP 1560/4]|eukprot:KNH03696.1 hypothetical protein XU18_4966 [Perkinsela sp. CCAP 1560/4]